MVASYRFTNPAIRQLGYLVWGVFACLAIFFFPERAIFTDAAFQNFHMLQEERLYISHGRFGNIIPQLIPWAVMKIGASLQAILVAYSLSFVLFFTAIYWLLVARLKNDFLGWALILYFSLMTYDSFFHVQSELYQGTAILFLFFGVVLNKWEKKWNLPKWGLIISLMCALAFYHKLTFLFFGFLWLYFLLQQPQIKVRKVLILLPLMIVIVIAKDMLWQSDYEDNRMLILKKGLADYFPNFWDIPANAKFLNKCLGRFILFPIILGILSFWYLKRKQLLKFSLVFGGSLTYILLVHYSSPNTSHDFYSEVTYRALGLIVGVPLVFDILAPLESYFAKQKRSGLLVNLLACIIAFRIIFITFNGMQFRDRRQSLSNLSVHLAKENNTCCTRMYTNQLSKELVINDWAIPYETLLSSALKTPDASTTLFLDDDFMEVYEDLNTGEKFLTRYDQISFDKLNPRFFRLGPDVYELIRPKD